MSKRWLFLSAAAVLIVVSLALVLLPGDKNGEDVKTEAGPAATAPAATRSVTNSPSATGTSTASASPSAHATDASKKPSTTSSARPSATTSATKSRQQAAGTASLAGRIRPGVTYRGVATFYDADGGGGACLYDTGDDVLTGAMNTTDYESSKACGAYVLVHAAGGATVTVRITNECPGDCAPGQIDLSAQAFAKLASPSAGRIPITWNLVSPSTSDTISIRYKTGSSRYWCGIQAIGHRNPLARLEVLAGGTWRQLPRASYNYFLSESGSGCGGAIRLTDIYGEQLTVPALAVRPDVVQATRLQFAKH
ncbi:RlpA-like double-psi beta-barrel domain-containing protein [Streptomyces sp. STR69]|uniref:RlpA-like double-psi beta-barrel domain-containing protein n=1 Tax=Streptomyces sp. STR69 TaxID=1796942 RepID=UPI0021C7F17A|nr:RlpA-like double-psi beta-barrel domain-containing protein [Streptomyces sp. STR69]